MSKAKDEFQIATNWRRIFSDLYRKMKWLNAYAEINMMAIKKIMQEFMEVHFDLKDNVINKNIMNKVK